MPWGPFFTWLAQILIIAIVLAVVVGLAVDAINSSKKKDR
jgi:hypothetical protein